jgi:hypothetical protein
MEQKHNIEQKDELPTSAHHHAKPLLGVVASFKSFFVELRQEWLKENQLSQENEPTRQIMSVHYYPDFNRVECYDWINVKINSVSGILTETKFNKIKNFCRTEKAANRYQMHTQFFSWSDINLEYIAYYEPIDNYLLDLNLWKIGQGYDAQTGKRYKSGLKCPICSRHYA